MWQSTSLHARLWAPPRSSSQGRTFSSLLGPARLACPRQRWSFVCLPDVNHNQISICFPIPASTLLRSFSLMHIDRQNGSNWAVVPRISSASTRKRSLFLAGDWVCPCWWLRMLITRWSFNLSHAMHETWCDTNAENTSYVVFPPWQASRYSRNRATLGTKPENAVASHAAVERVISADVCRKTTVVPPKEGMSQYKPNHTWSKWSVPMIPMLRQLLCNAHFDVSVTWQNLIPCWNCCRTCCKCGKMQKSFIFWMRYTSRSQVRKTRQVWSAADVKIGSKCIVFTTKETYSKISDGASCDLQCNAGHGRF